MSCPERTALARERGNGVRGWIAGLTGWAALGLLSGADALAADFRRGDVVEGPAVGIRDGSTLLVGGVPIRLLGVAAPPRLEPGGAAATEALRRVVQGRTIRCSMSGGRSHGAHLATCWIGTLDIGAAVIASGNARECRRASGGRYAALERPEAEILALAPGCG